MSAKKQHKEKAQTEKNTGISLSEEGVQTKKKEVEDVLNKEQGYGLSPEELYTLCREQICPQCDVGQKAEDVRLRSLAESDNTRKRLEKEKEDFRRFAAEKVLAELLPALDNLDLALQYSPQEDGCKNFVVGVQMTHKAFMETLENNGLLPVGREGEVFDPQLHEAVEQKEAAHVPAGQIVQVTRQGYILNGRLLRPAKVVVSK